MIDLDADDRSLPKFHGLQVGQGPVENYYEDPQLAARILPPPVLDSAGKPPPEDPTRRAVSATVSHATARSERHESRNEPVSTQIEPVSGGTDRKIPDIGKSRPETGAGTRRKATKFRRLKVSETTTPRANARNCGPFC